MERRLHRRDATKLLLGSTAAFFTGRSESLGWQMYLKEQSKAQVTSTQHALLEKIPELRAPLGLSGQSDEVITALELRNNDWQGAEPKPFQNRFPPYLYSFGELAHYFADVSFTERMTPYIVSGAEINVDRPMQYAFDIFGTRMVNFAHNAGTQNWTRYDPRGNSAPGYLCHEEDGHGTDVRGLVKKAPFDMAVRIAHGTWMMQSQMLLISGPLTESNAWRPNQWIAHDLGVAAGQQFVEKGRIQTTNDAVVNTMIADLAERQQTKPHDLRFNKKVCTMFGRRIIRAVEQGELVLSAELQRKHAEGLVRTLPETYAEMMMGCLINPDLVNNNPKVLAGAQEILSAIRGDTVPLELIRKQLRQIPDRIEQLREDEIATYSKEPPPLINRIITTDPSVIKQEVVFEQVAERGELGIPNDYRVFGSDRQLVAEYFHYISIYYSRYPELSERSSHKSREEFDPKRSHAWVTKRIEEATAPYKVRHTIKSGYDPNPAVIYLNDESREIMKKDIQEMASFHTSDAFGT